jgi:hypothetical protein
MTNGDLQSVLISIKKLGRKLCCAANADPLIVSLTSISSVAPNVDITDLYSLTALAEDITFSTPTGTPSNGQKLIIRILDNGVARNIIWSADYINGGFALPAITDPGKTMHCEFIYNTDNTLNKWQLIAYASEL